VRVIGLVLLACLGPILATVPTGAATLAASSVTAAIPSGTADARTHVPAITGQVTGPAGRLVLVQARAGQGWVTLGETTSRVDGTFSLATPTWWVGRLSLRTFAPATSEAAGAASTTTAILTVNGRYRPRGGTAFRHLGGYRARWEPCDDISYRVNPHRMPAGAMRDVAEAFRRLSEASGLRFSYAGPTSFVPYARRSRRATSNADVVLAWAPPRAVPSLAGTVVGLGGYAGAGTSTGWTRITQGYVVLDSTSRLHRGFAGRRSTRGMTLLHELGHAVGLDHVNDRRQVMYPVILPREAQYAAGDLRGLAAVGAARGCFPASTTARSATTRVFSQPRS
jgi:hypothetical protein